MGGESELPRACASKRAQCNSQLVLPLYVTARLCSCVDVA